jgi:hypothetical protein
MKFEKYKENLSVESLPHGKFVKSYQTYVAKIEGDTLIELGYWSVTTKKHINYVARELNLELVKHIKFSDND